MRTALTIAGSDSGGGAGIQADLKTFAAHGVYGTSAITALTAQNTLGVTGIHVVPDEFVTAQIEAVAGDLGCHAVKTGMLANATIVEAVAAAVESLELPNLVVDPVMVAKSGAHLLDEEAVHALRWTLIRLARVVTPNIPEAEVLAKMAIRSVADMREAATRIAAFKPAAVVIKGGHLPGAEVVDLLYENREFHAFTGARVEGPNTHGTGCTFAAAIAAHLALGAAVREAVPAAKAYVEGAIRHGVPLGRGHQPLHHFWRGIYCDVVMEPTAVTTAPLDVAAIVRALDASGAGAVATFVGLVRDHNLGRRVLHLEYEAYEPLARRGLDLIVAEARERWPAVRLMLHHRIGRMDIGEASVAIAAASPHRADAFAATRYAIERIKQIVPIWKHEYFEGGDVWIEGATADPDNAEAREQAMRAACR